jgi:L-seryl-tRNA(Ser) seleniumtransferase
MYLREGHTKSSGLQTNIDGVLARDGASGLAGIPVVEMLRASNEELRKRAQAMSSALIGNDVIATLGTGKSQVGGGTLPRSEIGSITLDLFHARMKPQEMAARLREHSVPVIGYVARGKLKLDLRTIFPSQDEEVIQAIRALSASHG